MKEENFKPKITITISTWYKTNTDYLKVAIDTIISQTFESWELIVVNDGASENIKDTVLSYSDKISVSLGKKDRRAKIKYFETKKAYGGPSVSRNIGLKNALGEYIFFHDHDDYLFCEKGNQYALENIFKEINNEDIDIFIFGMMRYGMYMPPSKFTPINLKIGITRKILSDFEKELYFTEFSCWNKLFRTKFLLDNNLYYSKKIIIGEDFEHHFRYIFLTDKIKFSDNAYYYYRYVDNSISLSCNKNYVFDAIIIKYIKESLISFGVWDTLRIYYIKFFLFCIGTYSKRVVMNSDNILKYKKHLRKYFKCLELKDSEIHKLREEDRAALTWLMDDKV